MIKLKPQEKIYKSTITYCDFDMINIKITKQYYKYIFLLHVIEFTKYINPLFSININKLISLNSLNLNLDLSNVLL